MKTVDIFYMAEIRPDGEVDTVHTILGSLAVATRVMGSPSFLETWRPQPAPGSTLKLIKVSMPFEVVELPINL